MFSFDVLQSLCTKVNESVDEVNLRLREFVMASKQEEILKNPSEINAESEQICEKNDIQSGGGLSNGTTKILEPENKKEHVENHVGHNDSSVNLQNVKKTYSENQEIKDGQGKILSENKNKILIESSKGKFECFIFCRIFSLFF